MWGASPVAHASDNELPSLGDEARRLRWTPLSRQGDERPRSKRNGKSEEMLRASSKTRGRRTTQCLYVGRWLSVPAVTMVVREWRKYSGLTPQATPLSQWHRAPAPVSVGHGRARARHSERKPPPSERYLRREARLLSVDAASVSCAVVVTGSWTCSLSCNRLSTTVHPTPAF